MIGPSIPEHLLKKQGTSDATGEEEQSSTSASNNIRSSGPQAPGPQDDSDDDDFGPALPPELAAARISKPADPSVGPSRPSVGPSRPPAGPERPAAGPSRPTAGPSLPAGPAPPSRRPVDDDSDDDDVGPMPLPAGVADASRTDGVQEFMERERRQQESAAAAERERLEGKKPKREEWMLVPPKESDLLGTMDTTKLKSRTFNTSAKTATKSKDSGSLWTETPAERQARMADEVLGKRKKAEVGAGGGGGEEDDLDPESIKRRRRDAQLREEVDRYNRENRQTSLVDKHSKSSKDKNEEEGPPGIWDRERDMGLGGRLMDDRSRKDAMKNAKDFSRFGNSTYL